MTKPPYRFIDLFAGAGGLSLGFVHAGFVPVWAVEVDQSAADTYEENLGTHVYRGDIKDIDSFADHSAELIIGGPPCQGFSPLGKMTAKKGRALKQQQLNFLWIEYLRAVREVKPLGFLVENVPEFIRSEAYTEFEKQAQQLGYNIVSGMLKAEQYGVPQRRRRGFIIGILHGPVSLPSPPNQTTTIREAIGNLPLNPTDKDLHWKRNPQPRSVERYKCVPPGGNRFDLMEKRPDLCPKCWLRKTTGSTDVFGRLEWDKQALTIRTEFFKPEKGCYLHPKAHRPITHREAARLQTFPDSFKFRGSKIEIARQIGNAVPPRLAKHIALHIAELLQDSRHHPRFFDHQIAEEEEREMEAT